MIYGALMLHIGVSKVERDTKNHNWKHICWSRIIEELFNVLSCKNFSRDDVRLNDVVEVGERVEVKFNLEINNLTIFCSDFRTFIRQYWIFKANLYWSKYEWNRYLVEEKSSVSIEAFEKLSRLVWEVERSDNTPPSICL